MNGKFHINSKGELSPCTANKKECPLGSEHFNNIKEAEEHFNQKYKNTFTHSKNKTNEYNKAIKESEKLQKDLGDTEKVGFYYEDSKIHLKRAKRFKNNNSEKYKDSMNDLKYSLSKAENKEYKPYNEKTDPTLEELENKINTDSQKNEKRKNKLKKELLESDKRIESLDNTPEGRKKRHKKVRATIHQASFKIQDAWEAKTKGDKELSEKRLNEAAECLKPLVNNIDSYTKDGKWDSNLLIKVTQKLHLENDKENK